MDSLAWRRVWYASDAHRVERYGRVLLARPEPFRVQWFSSPSRHTGVKDLRLSCFQNCFMPLHHARVSEELTGYPAGLALCCESRSVGRDMPVGLLN
jgi:hypothetical protein